MDEQSRKHLFESPVELKFILKKSSLSELMNPVDPPTARPLPSQEEDDMVGPTRAIRKKEFVRVILEALYALGYKKSAAALEEESGIYLKLPTAHLWNQLFDRKWDDVVDALHNIDVLDENTVKAASFLIYEHKFFQLLESNRLSDALETLTTEISSLGIDEDRVVQLTACINSSEQRAITPRRMLIVELQNIFPPTVRITDRRLEQLVEQAINLQKAACYFHNSLDTLWLYTDHQCEEDQVPSETIQILHAHQDEVWFLKFSNNGKYLASSSKDKSAIVWEVHEDGKLSMKHRLTGHERSVIMISWSPDDRQLLTCGFEEVIRRWNVSTGECLRIYQKRGLSFISCGWTLNGKYIISGATNKTMFLWDMNGRVMEFWRTELLTTTTMDLAVGKCRRGFICSRTNNCLGLVKEDKKYVKLINLENGDQAINSFSLSRNSEWVLLNLKNQEICLWRIVGSIRPLMRFKGHKCSGFLIRSCLGGSEDSFVASGSEDSQVYIWHAATGELIHKLSGHSDVVNCVSWNPINPHMFASASNDKTIRIWGLNTNTDQKPRDNLPSHKRKRS